jgi:signal transduction histidine kinase
LEQEEGVDLSLLAARELVELHGGKIWIEPGDEGGNNLCISLPKVAVRPEVCLATKDIEIG